MGDAFWGAFFAAVFSLFTLGFVSGIKAIWGRKVRHYNALVLLETELNRHIARLHDTAYVLKGFLSIYQRSKVSFDNLASLTVAPVKSYESLLDVDLINRLFSYDHGLEKLNDDLLKLSSTYGELRSSLLARNLNLKEFQDVIPDLPQNLKVLIWASENQLEKAIQIAAQVRLMLKRDRSKIVQLKHWVLRFRMNPLSHKDVEDEVKKVRSEIDEISSQSRREIDKFLSE